MNTPAAAPTIEKRNKVLDLIIRYPILPTFAFFVIMVITFIIVSPVGRDGTRIFLSGPNLTSIIEASASFAIGAFAMTLVVLVGMADFSAESVIALSCVVFAACLEVLGLSFPVSILLALSTGVVSGLVNSLIVVKFNVPPVLATIAISFVFSGLAFTISDARSIMIREPALIRTFGSFGSGASFLGLPALLFWTLFFLIVMYLVISKSKFGRWAQATGGNAQAAHSSGVNVALVRTVAFVIMGVTSVVVGFIFMARLSVASPSFGAGHGLRFIIAAIMGGTTFTGEGGSVFGTLLGALVMGVLTNGLGIIGINIYIQQVISGIVIVAAVVFSIYISNKK